MTSAPDCPDCGGSGRRGIAIACHRASGYAEIVPGICPTCRGGGIGPSVAQMMERAIAEAVRSARRHVGFSQLLMAKHLGVHARDLNEIEHGRLPPPPGLLTALGITTTPEQSS